MPVSAINRIALVFLNRSPRQYRDHMQLTTGLSIPSACLSGLTLFVRWRIPQVPHYISSPGFAVSAGYLMSMAFPYLRLPTVAAILLAVGSVAFAIEWQLSHPGPKAVAPRATEVAPSPVPPNPQPEVSAGIHSTVKSKGEASMGMVVHRAATQPDVKIDQKAVLSPAPNEMLPRLAQLYMNSHDGISSEMLAGLELPPERWLNEQLEKYGANWRVRNVRGPNAEAYPVSARQDAQGDVVISNNQSGGITAHTVNVSPVRRHLTVAMQHEITDKVPKDAHVEVESVSGDDESRRLAQEVIEFLNGSGYVQVQNVVSMFPRRVEGFHVSQSPTGWNILVGSNPDDR